MLDKITTIIVSIILLFTLFSFFEVWADTSAFESTYSLDSKYIIEEVSFPAGQEELAGEITKLLILGENNPELKPMVNSSMELLGPLMNEYRLGLVSDSTEIQSDYHKPRHRSLYDYQVTAWVEYPCQGQMLICKSLTNNNNVDRGTTFSTRVAIDSNPTGADLQFHHKIKNTSGYAKRVTSYHFGSFMDMSASANIGCSQPRVHTLNYAVNQSHDIRFCILQGIAQGDRADLSMIVR